MLPGALPDSSRKCDFQLRCVTAKKNITLPSLVTLIVFDAVSAESLGAQVKKHSAHVVNRENHAGFVTDAISVESSKAQLATAVVPAKYATRSIAADRDFAPVLAETCREFPGSDIAVVSATADLPFAWDARLSKACYAASNIAAATSLCDVGAMFELLDLDSRDICERESISNELIDRTAYAMGNRSYYDIPRAHANCTYLRRAALDCVLPQLVSGDPQSTLDQITKLLRARGWSVVLCDYLFVGRPENAIPLPITDRVEENAFRLNHPLSGLRRAVKAAITAGISSVSTPALDEKPVVLHIMHFWGGGLDKWVRDFGRADKARTNLVFSSFRIGENGGQRLVLYSDPVDPNPIRVWDIAQPIRSTLPASIEYRRILQQVIREFCVDSIVISSLIGHTLDALEQPQKTIVVCHDFYPICQAINPQFGTTCQRCTLEDLTRCAKTNPLNRIFLDQTSENWHEMRQLYLEKLIANHVDLVVPSASVATTLVRLAPRIRELTIHQIAHGIDLPRTSHPHPVYRPGMRLRLIVLGRMSTHKGSELLRKASAGLSQYADITLVGCGGNGAKLAEECQWNFIEKYLPEELPAIIAKLAPHAALLPSVIPETFSYTLSELNQLGVPSLATALGSFVDRIIDGETGFLFEPAPDALVSLVTRLVESQSLLVGVADNLRALPAQRTTVDMVRDYAKLIPAVPCPIARFEVGIGMATGLTEPYRQLDVAYVELTGAYQHAMKSFHSEHARAISLSDFKAICDMWFSEYSTLNVEKRWWRIPRALRLARGLYRQLQNLNAKHATQKPSSDQ